MYIQLLLEDKRWQDALGDEVTVIVDRITDSCLAKTPEARGFSPRERLHINFSVVLMDDARIHELNKEFREKDNPTNVLSFPSYDSMQQLQEAMAESPEEMLPDAAYLGDVIMAYDTMQQEAADQGKTLHDHFCHLLVHGWLHLLGYDHMETAEAEKMEQLETAILDELSIANPYA